MICQSKSGSVLIIDRLKLGEFLRMIKSLNILI